LNIFKSDIFLNHKIYYLEMPVNGGGQPGTGSEQPGTGGGQPGTGSGRTDTSSQTGNLIFKF
jgi:hypothetical protein